MVFLCLISNTLAVVPTELPVKWIKELEEETSALKGQPIYMTCELNKERDVVWKKNGQLLKQKANKLQINIIGMQHAVTIQNSSEEDGGVYSCEVANQEDVKTSTNVKCIGEKRGFCPTVSKHLYIRWLAFTIVSMGQWLLLHLQLNYSTTTKFYLMNVIL